MEEVDVMDLIGFWRSKYDIHSCFERTRQMLLPPLKRTTMSKYLLKSKCWTSELTLLEFLQQVLTGEKRLMPASEAVHIFVDKIPEVRISNL